MPFTFHPTIGFALCVVMVCGDSDWAGSKVVELRIIVPEELIMDGVVDIPSVGDYVEYAIAFRQADASTPPSFCVDVEARVEQLNEGRLSQDWIDSYGQNHPGTYAMLLYGDGWCAYFRSTAPYEGVVQLSGVFEVTGLG